MKAVTLLAAACSLAVVSTADARQRRAAVAAECNITMPCDGIGIGSYANRASRAVKSANKSAYAVYSATIARPLAFAGGRLNCARAVNAHVEASGRQGTGSARAASFANWGSRSGPVPGAVARYSCCGPSGHVAIVSHVDDGGAVWVWNPTRHGWKLVRQWREPIEYRA